MSGPLALMLDGTEQYSSTKTSFNPQRFIASSHKLVNAPNAPYLDRAFTDIRRSFAAAKGVLRPDVIDVLTL
ncbi:hypothetical protein AGR13a_Lc10081 [Agrobacterium genomosp. 13 str. CFBP 6927]|jgi:hypothetical protein|uniref:Uncharacterized protein n=1 Tax=Agrobacterium genomosp. 13 str. CFBP 6927 TaxID=1183428 RepID=A0ABP2BMB9_9HYPH|nr:hypothetical protein AGR13a_Lc10081 [Agrobacterium genomosp. 13 str. CFBP 6927]